MSRDLSSVLSMVLAIPAAQAAERFYTIYTRKPNSAREKGAQAAGLVKDWQLSACVASGGISMPLKYPNSRCRITTVQK